MNSAVNRNDAMRRTANSESKRFPPPAPPILVRAVLRRPPVPKQHGRRAGTQGQFAMFAQIIGRIRVEGHWLHSHGAWQALHGYIHGRNKVRIRNRRDLAPGEGRRPRV